MLLEPGSMLNDRYMVETILGEGGMGAVYRALDIVSHQPCAVKEFRLKFLPTEEEVKKKEKVVPGRKEEETVTREKALAQFKREAELLAQLDHPNLPKVIDYFSVGQEYYLVMTLIVGNDAAKLLASLEGKPLPERAVLNWIKQVLEALIYCHSKGVVHRDVKPANIILTTKGTVYLVDFGIAKVDNPTKETSIGARVVTPGYSPPEQYSVGQTDTRSDIYALGATMYAMLTGREPMESIRRLMGGELQDPRELQPSLSYTLQRAVLKSMSLSPDERFQSIVEMRDAIFSTKGRTQYPVEERRGVPIAAIPDAPRPVVPVAPEQQAIGSPLSTASPQIPLQNPPKKVEEPNLLSLDSFSKRAEVPTNFDVSQLISRKNVKQTGPLSSEVEKLNTIQETIQKIQPLASNIGRVIQAAEDPNMTPENFMKVFESDVDMYTKLLELSNRVSAMDGQKFTVMGDLVSSLGYARICTLVFGIGASALLKKDLPGYQISSDQLLAHATSVAMTAKWLMGKFNLPNPEDGYVAGLLHDLGKIILDPFVQKDYKQIAYSTQVQNKTLYNAEDEIVGINHAKVGSLMVKKWDFPETLAEAIYYHHLPSLAFEQRKLAAIINIADAFTVQPSVFYPSGGVIHPESIRILSLDADKFKKIKDEWASLKL